MKIVEGNLAGAKRCMMYICQKYHAEGYIVRQGQEWGTYVVNIRSTTTGFWGGVKKYSACAKDVTLRIGQKGSYLTVEASGDYGRQLATGGFGTFVAFGVVAVTAAAGSIGQHALANQVENDAVRFLEHESCLELPMASC